MRYMVVHKVEAAMERGDPPDGAIIQNMGKLIGRSLKEGVFKDGAGLHRSAVRARVTVKEGAPSVVRGPYAGGNELIAAWALISTTGPEKALELASELAEATGKRGAEIEVGPVVEGWDLNGSPRPAGAPHRFLLLLKGDAAYERGEPALAPQVRAILDRWKREGLLQSEATLAPTKTAARTRVDAGKRHWIDGPFAESKELIAGFSILELPTLADAKRWAEEYAAILGDNEVDIREVIA